MHALDGLGNAGRVPQLERAHLPVEAELHGAIDLDDRVGDFANAVCRVGPEIGEDGPEKDVGLVLRRRQHHAQTLGQIIDCLRHLKRRELRALRGAILKRLPIDREDFFLAIGLLALAIEAALGLVAEPLALQHLLEECGQLEIAALVLNVGGGVAHDVAKDVEADEVGEAEGRGLGPADGGAGQRVDLFDAQVHLHHDPHDVEDGEGADAVGDEVRRVLRVHHALAHVQIAEMGDGVHRGGIGVGRGDDLQQAHVARRIEEVGAKPGAAEVVGEAFDNFRDRQTAGIGGDDGAGLANLLDLAQQAALDLEIFDDGFDDPVDIGELVEIVLEVADGDQARERGLKESGGLGLDGGFQSGGGDAVARGAVGVGRHDVEQIRRNTGVGQVCGDAGAHGARAQNGDSLNPLQHEML